MNNLSEYLKVVEQKRHINTKNGIDPVFMPDIAFDHQKYAAEKNIISGRKADYVDTGMGKTIINLITLQNYVIKFNKPVLIITPLAVAFQFISEAEKFGIDGVEYSKDGKWKATTKIVICNYERLHFFDSSDFIAIALDESSILKNSEGATRQKLNTFLKKVKYRFLFTATPSPNDFVELGTSSEALGFLGFTDMLTKFFKNNENTVDPMSIGTKWVLRPHAEKHFFDWVRSWSLSMRKPSDVGFSDEGYILPELHINDHAVKNKKNMVINGQIMMFPMVAQTLSEVRAEQKDTIQERCEKAVDLASKHETSVYWCNLNKEGDLLQQLDKGAVQISGSMSLEKKEDILQAFSKGQIKKLITKADITGFGLNWQHCGHTVFFPTFSYEEYKQAICRFYRFGRVDPVIVDRVFSDGQAKVIQAIDAKAKKADMLYSSLNASINEQTTEKRQYQTQINLPSFLKAS